MSEMRILDRSGDSRLMWNKSDGDEVRVAEERFEELKKAGYAFFSVTAKGDKGTQIDEFDPHAERLIAVPQMVGGAARVVGGGRRLRAAFGRRHDALPRPRAAGGGGQWRPRRCEEGRDEPAS